MLNDGAHRLDQLFDEARTPSQATDRAVSDSSSAWTTNAEKALPAVRELPGASVAEHRSAARGVDAYLTGHSELPAPVHPTGLPLAAV